MPRPVGRPTAFVLFVAAVAGACGGGTGDDELVVFAASSLTDAFERIEAEFEAANPDVDVVVNFGGSSTLAAQVLEGAPVDVIATADTVTMQPLEDAGELSSSPQVFARNRATIVVGPGNPKGITGIADLAADDLIVLTCAIDVPCGAYAAEVFDLAGVAVTPDSFEANVGAVVNKVALGEADAGIAYVSDVVGADGRVDGIDIADNVDARYPIAVSAEADDGTAAAFVAFVLGPDGRRALDAAGFLAP